MAKNNYFINQVKEIERIKKQLNESIKTNTAHIYACFCKVLMIHTAGVMNKLPNYSV